MELVPIKDHVLLQNKVFYWDYDDRIKPSTLYRKMEVCSALLGLVQYIYSSADPT